MRKRTIAALATVAGIIIAGMYGPVSRAGVSCSVPFTFQNNTTADATQVNSNFSAIITCLSNAAAAGINSDITQLIGLTTPLSPGQGGTPIFAGGQSTGATNAQVVATTTPNSFSLVAGYRVTFIAGFTNTAALQLNVRSTGLQSVYRRTNLGATSTVSGEVIAGNPYSVTYDGSKFILDSDDIIKVGNIEYGGWANPPPGRLLAQGQAISRTTYAALYSLYGTTYAVGDGVTTFNLPDLRGRIATMQDTALRITTSCPNANVIGTTCGAQNQTIAQANLPDYVLPDPGHIHSFPHSLVTFDVGGSGTFNPSGASVYNAANTNTQTSTTGVHLGGSGSPLPTLAPTQIVNAVVVY